MISIVVSRSIKYKPQAGASPRAVVTERRRYSPVGSHLPSPVKSDASRASAASRIAVAASSAVDMEGGEGGEEAGDDEDEEEDEEDEEVMTVSASRITSLGGEGVGMEVSGPGNMAAAAAEGSKPVWQARQSVAWRSPVVAVKKKILKNKKSMLIIK